MPVDSVDTLRTLLATAKDLVERVADDPVRVRWLRLYDQVPVDDRSVLVDVLEREVGIRTATQADG